MNASNLSRQNSLKTVYKLAEQHIDRFKKIAEEMNHLIAERKTMLELQDEVIDPESQLEFQRQESTKVEQRKTEKMMEQLEQSKQAIIDSAKAKLESFNQHMLKLQE